MKKKKIRLLKDSIVNRVVEGSGNVEDKKIEKCSVLGKMKRTNKEESEEIVLNFLLFHSLLLYITNSIKRRLKKCHGD